ncbi:MAG: methyltransferase domain-containing protein [Pelagimonas sp.]|uniref:methyltransferase domain-containing protein n=1 Tax=Pelagimonas sp. TaxID=2073170 RepID=UPI003D6C50A4
MTTKASATWNPEAYLRFKRLRLRPALDLIRALPALPEGPIVDLGCGSGSVGEALAGFGRPLMGVDNSEEMLAEAQKTGVYDTLTQTDISTWSGETAPALIFSNAALQWVPNHADILPRLVNELAPGGVLALQVPHQNHAPSHHIWKSLAEEFWPGRIDFDDGPSVLPPANYYHLLGPLGDLSLWETEYYQVLEPADTGHPVRRFTESTYGLPILQKLEPAEKERLIQAYEAVIGSAYPSGEDGTVLFPFRRMFMILTRS